MIQYIDNLLDRLSFIEYYFILFIFALKYVYIVFVFLSHKNNIFLYNSFYYRFNNFKNMKSLCYSTVLNSITEELFKSVFLNNNSIENFGIKYIRLKLSLIFCVFRIYNYLKIPTLNIYYILINLSFILIYNYFYLLKYNIFISLMNHIYFDIVILYLHYFFYTRRYYQQKLEEINE